MSRVWTHQPGDVYQSADHTDFDFTGVDFTLSLGLPMGFSLRPAAAVDLLTKWTPSAQQSWRVRLTTTGTVELSVSTTGANTLTATSTVALPVNARSIRVTVDRDNGAAGWTATFAYSLVADPIVENDASWVTLGASVVTATVLTIFNGTAAVIAGGSGGVSTITGGSIRWARIATGLPGATTLRSNPTFTVNLGSDGFVDSQSKVWTILDKITVNYPLDSMRNNLHYLYERAHCTVLCTTPVTSTASNISFDTEVDDFDGMWAVSPNPSRVTIPSGWGGLWLVEGWMWFAHTAPETAVFDDFQGQITSNIGDTITQTNFHAKRAGDYYLASGAIIHIRKHLLLEPGNYVEMKPNSFGSTTTQVTQAKLELTWRRGRSG